MRKNEKKSQFSKQVTIISVLAVLALVFFIVFKVKSCQNEQKPEEKNQIENVTVESGETKQNEVKTGGQGFVNEYGDSLEMFIVDAATGKSITQDVLDMLEGKKENEWNVRYGEDGKSILFDKNDVVIHYFPLMYPEILLSELSKITVTNEFGTYSVIVGTDGVYIEGAEYNIYNEQPFSSLILQARYMLANGYVENPLGLSEYGLDEGEYSAKVAVEDKSGNVNTVYIGNNVLNDSQFYMKHEDKDMIYLMDSSVAVFLDDVTSFLNPVVVPQIPEQQCYYFTSFAYIKNNEPFFACEIIPDAERTGAYINQLHRMTYPEGVDYVLNIDTLYEMFIQIGSLTGSEVVKYGVSKSQDLELISAFYGLDNPTAAIAFNYNGDSYRFTVGKEFVSETGEYYFVYSNYQDTIVLVPASSLSFIENELEAFYETSVFQYNINDVAEVKIKYADTERVFKLSESGSSLEVVEESNSQRVDTQSFRKLYTELLGIGISGNTTIDSEAAKQLEHLMTFKVVLRNGAEIVYDFYPESTLNCYMVISGRTGFKTERLRIEKIIEYSEILASGGTL